MLAKWSVDGAKYERNNKQLKLRKVNNTSYEEMQLTTVTENDHSQFGRARF